MSYGDKKQASWSYAHSFDSIGANLLGGGGHRHKEEDRGYQYFV